MGLFYLQGGMTDGLNIALTALVDPIRQCPGTSGPGNMHASIVRGRGATSRLARRRRHARLPARASGRVKRAVRAASMLAARRDAREA